MVAARPRLGVWPRRHTSSAAALAGLAILPLLAHCHAQRSQPPPPLTPQLPLLWPLPSSAQFEDGGFELGTAWRFDVPPGCALLERAASRYRGILDAQLRRLRLAHVVRIDAGIGDQSERFGPSSELQTVRVLVADQQHELTTGTNESFALVLAAPVTTIEAHSMAGALRGMETFSQSVVECGVALCVRTGRVRAAPQYTWRSLMLDVGSRYIPTEQVQRVLDAMSYSMLNVLHLHFSEGAYRVESRAYPALNEGIGGFYTEADVRGLLGSSLKLTQGLGGVALF